MAQAKTGSWQVALWAVAVLLLVKWLVGGHLITGLAALFLLLAMSGEGLLYRFQGPPDW